MEAAAGRSKVARLTPFAVPEAMADAVDIGTKQGHNFSAERAEPNANVFDAVTQHVAGLQRSGKNVVIALWSEGARERMSHVLRDHGLANLANVGSWQEALARPKTEVALAVLGLESGFESAQAAIIGEQDILGDRLVRPRRASRARREFHRGSHEPLGWRSCGACRSRHRALRRLADGRSSRRTA